MYNKFNEKNITSIHYFKINQLHKDVMNNGQVLITLASDLQRFVVFHSYIIKSKF